MSLYHQLFSRWNLDKIALSSVFGDEQISYAQLHQRVLQTVAFLEAQGVSSGDIVCVQLPKSPELLWILLACFAKGCPVLPLNDQYTATEVALYVEDSTAQFAFVLQPDKLSIEGTVVLDAGLSREIPLYSPSVMPPAVDGDALALFLYTSGTTGKPKGAMITHNNIMACVRALHEAWQWTNQDRLLHLLPLFHVHGLVVAQLGALYANAQSVWCKFDSTSIVDVLLAHDITICMTVPTIVYGMVQVEHVPPLPQLRLVTSGSAPLAVAIHEEFLQKWGIQIVERYGMTEVGIVLSNPYNGLCRPGTVGFPLGDTQFRIVSPDGRDIAMGEVGEVGELWIRGSSVIRGYWRQPEQTAQTITDGWLHSGDLAMLDAQGYYSIVGRAKELIISGGYNVYPREIENCILQLEGVVDVAVIGLPDEKWGEIVVAVVIGSVSWESVQAHCAEHVASYKCPRRMYLVDAFPRNAMGKVQKMLLRGQILNQTIVP